MLRLLAGHPDMNVVYATADTPGRSARRGPVPGAGRRLPRPDDGDVRPGPSRRCRPRRARPARTRPAWRWPPQLIGRVGCIVDLSAAYRLKDASLYPQWYGFEHDQPELLAEAVYGLPERTRADLAGARLVATPGCYVTAATMALAPLLDAGLLDPTGPDRRRRQRGVGRGPGPDADQRVLHRRRELQRLRPAGPSPHARDRTEPRRRPGAVHAPPRTDEPGHPRHLLRPPGRRAPSSTPSGC